MAENLNPVVRSALSSMSKKALIGLATASAAGLSGLVARRRKRRRRRNRRKEGDSYFTAPVSRGRIIRNAKVPTVRIRHREYLRDIDVVASTDARWILAINPGTMFPWLSSIATAFEKYRFHSLRFEFVTATATSTTGAVALAPEYDPDDNNYGLTKQQLYMFDGVVRGPLWESLALNFRVPNRQMFTRDHTTIGSLKWHDPGKLIIDVSSPSVTATIGELWVEYDVSLSIPEFELSKDITAIESTSTWLNTSATYHAWPGNGHWTTGGVHLYGEGIVQPWQDLDSVESCWLKFFVPGEYQIVMEVSGATNITNFTASGAITLSGAVGADDAASLVTFSFNVAATEATAVWHITVGDTYDGTFGTWTRTAADPLYVNLGQLYCATSPTSVTLHYQSP